MFRASSAVTVTVSAGTNAFFSKPGPPSEKDGVNPDPTRLNSPRDIVHAMTVDVEDYFHVEAFRRDVSRERWDEYPLRVERNTHRLLDLFDEFDVKATFFTLGWVARKCPRLVEEIVRRGHELACHSYWHRLVYKLDPEEFRRDTEEATRALEDAGQTKLRGYRSPSFSITKRSLWALEVLAACGYRYDSSIFPVRHDVYGFPEFPRFPVSVEWSEGASERSAQDATRDATASGIIEFPPCTVRLFGRNLPGPGGGYLRLFPLRYSLWALKRLESRDGRPGTIYLHPWEIDPEQPRLEGRLKSRLRHYTGLARTEVRLRTLMRRFRFAPMGKILEQYPPIGIWPLERRLGDTVIPV